MFRQSLYSSITSSAVAQQVYGVGEKRGGEEELSVGSKLLASILTTLFGSIIAGYCCVCVDRRSRLDILSPTLT
jgi:hypothetical protein